MIRTAPRLRSDALFLCILATILLGTTSMPARGGGFGGKGAGEEGSGESAAPVRSFYLYKEMTPRAAKTWLRLQEPIVASFPNETPLEDFLKYFKEVTRGKDKKEPPIAIYADPIGLNEAERTNHSPITIDLEDIPAATVLELTLRQLGLRFHVQKDGIVIITSESSEDPIAAGDPTVLLLNSLSELQTEVASLKREVMMLRQGALVVGPLKPDQASGDNSGARVKPGSELRGGGMR